MVIQTHQVLASSWSLAHTVRSLTLRLHLHVAEISMALTALNQFMAHFPATKNGDNPIGVPVLSRKNRMIELLHHLSPPVSLDDC